MSERKEIKVNPTYLKYGNSKKSKSKNTSSKKKNKL